jgi:hypothetical protein
MFLVFGVFFLAFMYSKGMLWFQQDNASGTDNWLTRYRAKDIATGSWGRRFVIPAAALFLILLILYPVVMDFLELSSFQRLSFLMFYFVSTFVIFIFSGVRHLRISRHVLETSTEDPFPDAPDV